MLAAVGTHASAAHKGRQKTDPWECMADNSIVSAAAQALLLIAFKVPDLKLEVHGALQVAILAVATRGSLEVHLHQHATSNCMSRCAAFGFTCSHACLVLIP